MVVTALQFFLFLWAGLGAHAATPDGVCGDGGKVVIPVNTNVDGIGDSIEEAIEWALVKAAIVEGAHCPHEVCGWTDCEVSIDWTQSAGTIQNATFNQNPAGEWTMNGTIGAGGYNITYLCGCP